MRRHVADPYVKAARAQGYRSRAAFKLIEIDAHDKLIRPGMRVVDLGATPGSWTQVIVERAGPRGVVVALDMLPMDPLRGVEFIQGDFREQEVLDALEKALGGLPVDLVVSDMAPNISGISSADQARSLHLCELALEFACKRASHENRAHGQQRGALLERPAFSLEKWAAQSGYPRHHF